MPLPLSVNVESPTVKGLIFYTSRKWGKITFDHLKKILETEKAAQLQMHYISGYTLSDRKMEVTASHMTYIPRYFHLKYVVLGYWKAAIQNYARDLPNKLFCSCVLHIIVW